MGLLAGKQFFSWEIRPVLRAALNEAIRRRMAVAGYEKAAGDERAVVAYGLILGLEMDAQQRADTDANSSANPKLYRRGDGFWNSVDQAVTMVASPSVEAAVNALPVDPSAPALFANPKLVFGALGAAVALGYLWTRR